MENSSYGSTDGLKQAKFWIKEGMPIAHKSNPYREMTVKRIVRKTHKFKNKDGVEIEKIWTIGIECHWISDTGSFEKGMFFTNELVPYNNQFDTHRKP